MKYKLVCLFLGICLGVFAEFALSKISSHSEQKEASGLNRPLIPTTTLETNAQASGTQRDIDALLFQEELGNVVFALAVSGLLESGDLQNVKDQVAGRLDGSILAIDELIPRVDPGLQHVGTNTLKRVATFRREHPSSYQNKTLTTNEMVLFRTKIDSVLDRFGK